MSKWLRNPSRKTSPLQKNRHAKSLNVSLSHPTRLRALHQSPNPLASREAAEVAGVPQPANLNTSTVLAVSTNPTVAPGHGQTGK